MDPRVVRSLLALTAAAALFPAPRAAADVKTASYSSDQQFAYEVLHLPDLDQVRMTAPGAFGLPGNGLMHCVPTASMNMVMYAANHGFPEVSPGPGDWQLQSNYNAAGILILGMGQNMGTDPVDGTGGKGWFDGLHHWLLPSGKFTVSQYTASANYAPRMTDMAKSALAGSIVSFAYGRYDVVGVTDVFGFGKVWRIARDGGHVVTMSKALRSGDAQALWSRDPAAPNDGMAATQSTFGNTPYVVSDLILTTSASPFGVKLMSALNHDAAKFDPAKDKLRLIDQYTAIRPKAGYTWKKSALGWEILVVYPFLGTGAAVPAELVLNGEGTLLDVAIDPDQNGFAALVQPVASTAPVELVHVDLLAGKVERLLAAPGARKLAFGRKRELYVLGAEGLDLVETTANGPAKTLSLPLPFPGDALAIDDARDQVVVLSAAARRLMRLPTGLHGHVESALLPATLPLAGAVALAVDPATGRAWIGSEEKDGLFGVLFDAAGNPQVEALLLPAVQKLTSIEVDDGGNLVVVAAGALVELTKKGEDWQQVDSAFAKVAAGAAFRLTHSRTNFDAATMSGPEWRHLAAADLTAFGDVAEPDCEASAADVEYGAGKAGTFGVPRLSGVGAPVPGAVVGLRIDQGFPGALPVLVLGLAPLAAPFDGGTLLADPAVVVQLPIPLDATGHLAFEGTMPTDAALCGLTLYHQALFQDPSAAGHYKVALTNGLARTFGSH